MEMIKDDPPFLLSAPAPSPHPPPRTILCYQLLCHIGNGTYGTVYRAVDKSSGELVAIKRLQMDQQRPGGPQREIRCLDSCRHPYVLGFKEVLLPPEAQDDGTCIYIVTELANCDLSALLHSMPSPFDEPGARQLMRQLLQGLAHLHRKGVLHRDIKPANLLLTGTQGTLKIADFGLCRLLELDDDEGTPHDDHHGGSCYTNPVVTLWYRAPELLMGTDHYSKPIDIWSVGCVMAELLAKEPLFTGRTEMEQLCRIFDVFGLPDKCSWPAFADLPGADILMMNSDAWPTPNLHLLRQKFPNLSPEAFGLLAMLLTCNPSQRITAEEALRHPWFSAVSG